ncbi:hypothetical protein AB0K12_02265 [Nonomuraea sp. NPDC049419]|uniref:hypothetical protein n=1 Tax=Nonomuraea sp. NPDC049419 TaxID=3155772 RepID=UPI0034354071
MAYESDRNEYLVALGLAGLASTVMPYARPLVALMAMVTMDPAEQDRAADQWLDATPVGVKPVADSKGSPGAAVGAGDLAVLRSELKRMVAEIGKQDWKGQAYTTFQKRAEELDRKLETLDRNREGCGQTLKASAHISHWVLQFFKWIARALAGFAALVVASTFNPVARIAVMQSVMKVVVKIHATALRIFTNHRKVILRVAMAVGAAGVVYNQASKDLLAMNAVPTKTPDLIDGAIQYDVEEVDFTKSPLAEAGANKPDLGILGNMGV